MARTVTTLVIQNDTSSEITLDKSNSSDVAPDPIAKYSTGNAKHSAEANSLGTLVYKVKPQDNKDYWLLITWIVMPGSDTKNQTTTRIFGGGTAQFISGEIRRSIEQFSKSSTRGSNSSDAQKGPLSASVTIDRYSDSPTLTAVFKEN